MPLKADYEHSGDSHFLFKMSDLKLRADEQGQTFPNDFSSDSPD